MRSAVFSMQMQPIGLSPEQDLRRALDLVVSRRSCTASFVISRIGSLSTLVFGLLMHQRLRISRAQLSSGHTSLEIVRLRARWPN
jgi:hypothetical protein